MALMIGLPWLLWLDVWYLLADNQMLTEAQARSNGIHR